MNLLSGTQLRFLARIRALRPSAELHWRGDGTGWSLEVVEHAHGKPDEPLLGARLDCEGHITTTRSWL